MRILLPLRSRAAAAAALLLLAAGCRGSTSGDLGAQAAKLRAARERWAASRPAAYSFTVHPVCFCAPGTIRVTVAGGVATSRVFVETGEPVSENLFTGLSTVDAMLGSVGDAIAHDAASLDTGYDDRGVPAHVRIDYRANVIDEEFGWEVTELTSAPD
jgi:hypothetical protein